MVGLNGFNAALFVALVVARIGAFRVSVTGQEMPVFANFDVQLMLTALRAGDVRVDADALDTEHSFFCGFQLFLEWIVKLFQHTAGIKFGGFDAIQVIFHFGGEFNSKNFGKVVHQQIVDDKSQFTGMKSTFDQIDIAFLSDGGQDGGIGARPTDTVFLQFLDQ